MFVNKRYIRYGLISSFFLIGYLFYQQIYQKWSEEKHQKALRACTTTLQNLRSEASKIKPVNLYPVQQNGKYGYKNGYGKIMIQPQFHRTELFHEGRGQIIDRNWFQGFINAKGEIVIPQEFRGVTDFAGGVAYFSGTREDQKKRGFIDRNGNIILELRNVDAHIETFPYSGFNNGRITAYLHKHESVPWGGFLFPYGNPVPRVYGSLDCTGKVTFEEFVWTIF
ncbi:WG repeat-containing protein [Lusitaniella coriacea LEGE 07157]|uniref:WG repeat-containing protein n=1 Tax=Lusitaniella coriacea LEGE 07157 TaxID=945747 RepID=A0A8J7ANJ4_9CYAN|nr:WG repeat-containing protein [Lusitaniella coriacea]MBE9114993.1 WG repeat-containing protein [Lusitaniella coriacea LEGE 07157]